MTHTNRTSLYTTAAISAALAFVATPALAQDAAPSIVLPAPEPQPAIVLPPQTSAPAVEAPAPAEEPAARPAPKARAEAITPRPTARTTAPAATAPVEIAAPVAPIVINTPPVAMPEPAPADARQDDSVRASVDLPDELIGVVGFGVLALGAIGLVSLRRRRREREALENASYETEHVAEEPITSIPRELAFAPTAPAVATSALPDGPVAVGEDRGELIRAMVAAPPDSDNPFTSPKARRRRARLILQAREQAHNEQSAQPFDWRTYQSPTTPSLAPPPMVDA